MSDDVDRLNELLRNMPPTYRRYIRRRQRLRAVITVAAYAVVIGTALGLSWVMFTRL